MDTLPRSAVGYVAGNRPTVRSRWPAVAIVAVGMSLAVIVAADGTLLSRLSKLVFIVALTIGTSALWLRPGRAGPWAALSLGTAGLVAGVGIGLRWLSVDGISLIAVSGLVALLASLPLVAAGIARLTYHLGAVMRLGVTIVMGVAVAVLVWTLSPALIATRVPPIAHGAATPADFGLDAEEVRFRTADDVDLWAWFIPPTEGATVVLRHGSGSTASSVLPQAEVLAGHGFGVLVPDARGHGFSGGQAMDFGWNGEMDIMAAVDFLVSRPEVDSEAIAVVGMSMGGEEAIGAIGADSRIAAVVAEGATARTDADKVWFNEIYGARGWLQSRLEWMQYGLTDLLTEASKPDALAASAQSAFPRSILMIAGSEMPDETHAAEYVRRQAGENVSVWVVPGAGHIQGLAVAPDDWSREVIGFLETALAEG